MSNMYHDDDNQEEEYLPHSYYEPAPTPRQHPLLKLLLTVVLAFLAGLGGAYVGLKQFGAGKTTIVYQQADPIPTTSNTSQVQKNELSIHEIAEKASVSVVEVRTKTEVTSSYGFFAVPYSAEGAGSGVVITSDGYIITNNHVVQGAEAITVTMNDGTVYDATLVGTDAKSDIGVIKIEATNLTPATVGDSSLIRVGDTAVVIGNPLGTLGGTVTNGIISATDREVVINNEAMNLIQTNAAINNGNSGGGLFDGHGNLIGIVNAKDSGVTSSGSTIEGLGFAIPVNDAMDVAEDIITHGKVTNRAMLGVTLQTVNQTYGSFTPGLYVTDILSGSGAEAAGIKPGDKIIAADGQNVSSYTDLSKILKKKSIGDTIIVKVERSDEELEFNVTLTGTLN
ncbi:MAG: trypsin-like peptidase domain-containing protein [Solobacterium sp.]|nr:trypsin-like peptidase domain-containing protein [Solobacterium sp.]